MDSAIDRVTAARSKSPFLQLLRRRFDKQNDPTMDPVPWSLDDKDSAYKLVSAAGYRVPRYQRSSTPQEALAVGETFGDRFVVKQPNRHSTMGVYILEKLDEDRYLDLFSLTEKTASDIKAVGPSPDYWLTEECLPSLVAGRPLPFDYKVYAFRGEISHVVQIDRNVYPPRIAVFDGAFIPLQPGEDYTTDPDRWLLENHVLPKHAGAILEMASNLSRQLDTRFVRVDCYDGPDGPVFGEFTFASGPDDVGMLLYSDRILGALDNAVMTGSVDLLSGFDIEVGAFRTALSLAATIEGNDQVISQLSGGAVQGDIRYAPALLRYLTLDRTSSVFTLATNLIGFMNGDGSRAFSIQAALRGKPGFIAGESRLEEFAKAAIDFHDSRAKGNPWHTSRAAEVRLMNGDYSALDVLREVAAAGYPHAARVLARYEAMIAQ